MRVLSLITAHFPNQIPHSQPGINQVATLPLVQRGYVYDRARSAPLFSFFQVLLPAFRVGLTVGSYCLQALGLPILIDCLIHDGFLKVLCSLLYFALRLSFFKPSSGLWETRGSAVALRVSLSTDQGKHTSTTSA
jgi:hypothetical protein